jgi:hypothetical protein
MEHQNHHVQETKKEAHARFKELEENHSQAAASHQKGQMMFDHV